MKPVEILVVEDNRGDVVLLEEAMSTKGLPHRLNVVRDGVEAVDYLRHQGRFEKVPRPDLIVLDLKLPRRNGREVFQDIQSDPELRQIPVVIVSSSQSELELARSARPSPESCIAKPETYEGYVDLVGFIEDTARRRLRKAS